MAKYKLCPDCGQPMLPKGTKKKPNEYDHASGCPRAAKLGEFPICESCGETVTVDWEVHFEECQSKEEPPHAQ